MSSEALEAKVAQIQEAYLDDAYGSSFQLKVAAYWPEIMARLAEVARLEQERDEALSVREGLISPVQRVLQLRDELAEERRAALQDRGLLPASEGLTAGEDSVSPAVAPANDLWQKIQDQRAANAKLQRKYGTVKGSLAAAEAVLAVAREREQRLRDALQEMVAAHYSAGESERDSPREQLALRDARAALVDEPAAAGEVRGRPVQESARQPARGSDTPTGAAPDVTAAATLAEPGHGASTVLSPTAPTLAKPGRAESRPLGLNAESGSRSDHSPGSASAAADEPGETP